MKEKPKKRLLRYLYALLSETLLLRRVLQQSLCWFAGFIFSPPIFNEGEAINIKYSIKNLSDV
jgi:hypothetical protein